MDAAICYFGPKPASNTEDALSGKLNVANRQSRIARHEGIEASIAANHSRE
jgi:hypothetical protein